LTRSTGHGRDGGGSRAWMLLGRCLWLAALLLSLAAYSGAASYVKELQGVTLKIVRDRSVREALHEMLFVMAP
jgi:hypothetical protein